MTKQKKIGGSNNLNNRRNNLGSGTNSTNNVNRSNNISSSNSDKSNKKLILIICGILAVIVLILLIYFLYKYYKDKKQSYEITKQMIPYIHDASIDKRFNYSSLPMSSEGNEYNINFWIYINDYVHNKGKDKCILYKGNLPIGQLNSSKAQNINANPSIWLLENVNTLRVNIGLDTNYETQNCDPGASATCQERTNQCDIQNFPLQTWVNINVSLRQNVIDIYLNGELHKSCILHGSPTINKGDLYVTRDDGFNGYISNLKWTNKALSVQKISKLYKDGPTLGSAGFMDKLYGLLGYKVKVVKI